ncbi:MAG: D-alanyl-D-alanine carboxypeptidase, partial [Candidatus Dadabacteria bacterium]
MRRLPFLLLAVFACFLSAGCDDSNNNTKPLPEAMLEVMNKPLYADATWSLKVVDLESGENIYDLNSDILAFTGSVRKTFSVGMALNELGADHRFRTPVYARGELSDDGVLTGDLILVADGDLTMGGRNTPEGTVAYTSFDHTEANSLGSAILTEPDPLQGIDELAAQVAASGITEVNGDVVVDDRLFDLFRVPNGNVLITPMIINDNLVDVTIIPTEPGQPAIVDWRPKSAAFDVEANVTTGPAGGELDLTFTGGEVPGCIGAPGCKGTVTGQIPADYKPALPGIPTLVRTFSIQDPSSYARILLIEAL